MVAILATTLTDGLPAVEATCAQAISEGVHSSDVITNILAGRRDPGPIAPIFTPDALKLRKAPVAYHLERAGPGTEKQRRKRRTASRRPASQGSGRGNRVFGKEDGGEPERPDESQNNDAP